MTRGRQRSAHPARAHPQHPRAEAEELHQPGDACREESRAHLGVRLGWQAFRRLRALDVRPRPARFSRSRLFSPTRRVVVKARVVRQKGRAFRSAPLTAHLSYLKREGVTRSGERAEMFDAGGDRADGAAFAERCEDDRHHFRFIVSPEDAGEMTDLRAFTRDLARQMEVDLGTRLDWVAVDHWNTDNPHVHLLVRGVDRGRRRSRDLAATTSAGACARAPRNWSPSSWAQEPSMKSAMRWRGRSRRSDGRGSIARSALAADETGVMSIFAPRIPARRIPRSAA